MLTRLLPTLLIAAAGLILAAAAGAVCAAVDAVRRRRDAQRAEHAARPRDSHTATATRDAATTLHTRIQEQHHA